MKLIGDICFPTGKYQDRNTGEEKTRWSRCGVLVQNEQGEFRIKLETIPLNGGEGWFSVFDRKQQGQPEQQKLRSQPPAVAPSTVPSQEDIPW